MSNLISSQINISKDTTREHITKYIKTYLELENIDLTKSSFLSFIIDIISTLTSNLMFYQTSVYNEFFLTKSKLPESVFNLSAFLGYNTQEAIYSSVNVLINIPFGFTDPTSVFTIPKGFKFTTSDNIEFITYYITTITITDNNSAEIILTEGTKKYHILADTESSSTSFSFVLPLKQYKEAIQEFQIDSDLETYQFVNKDIPVNGKVSKMMIEFKEPDETFWTEWTEYSSLYLLNKTSKGYVSRRTDSGRKLYFGNGIIGVQPSPGSTLKVTTNVTQGADGNIIAGSIKKGERIYVSSAGINQIVNYTVTNPSPAINGKDEESIEDIRKNSILSITSLNRLVTQNDYKNLNVIIPSSPLSSDSLTVLKRSDIKVNDIQVYTTLQFGADLVPTRNIKLTIPLSTTYISRGTEIIINDISFYTLFDMSIDLLNSVANYNYIMYQIEIVPSLITSYSSSYNIYTDNLIISKDENKAIFKLHYQSKLSDCAQCSCKIQILSTSITYNMINDSTSNFIYEFDPYTLVPSGEETYYFTISDPNGNQVGKYSISATFRKELYDFMLSNTFSDSTSTTIYDIPVIQKSYYDGIIQSDFEKQVLQSMMNSLSFSDYKMLTDFTNVKFANTTGFCQNMIYNPTNRQSVLDIVTEKPLTPSVGDRYILTEETTYENNICECTDSTNITWIYTVPVTDDILYVENQSKKYMFSTSEWVSIPIYNIPLKLKIEIFKDVSYPSSSRELSDLIRTTLVDTFKDRFGQNIHLYRSEIIDVIQSIEGIDHCQLLKPETNIFFNFELTDLTEDELLEYTPEYIYFEKTDIEIRIHI